MKPLQGLSDRALAALEARGIDPELASRYGVVSAQPDSRGDDREWVAFRHHVDGGSRDHWAFRTVTGEKDFRQSSNTKRVLWNNEAITDRSLSSSPLLVAEGHIDALELIGAGFPRTVSVPDGAPSKPIAKKDGESEGKGKYSYLEGSGLEDVKEIILATDNDNPGYALNRDLVNRLGAARCRWVKFPEGCKDPNQTSTVHGRPTLVRCVNTASWYKIGGLYTYDQLPPEPVEEVVPIGIHGIDFWSLSRGRMSVITGIPGHGKSAFITDVVCHMADQGWVIGMASFEDTPRGTLAPRLIRWKLRKDPSRASATEIAEAEAWVQEHFIFVQPDDDDEETPTVDWLMERYKAGVIRHNVSMWIVDPWNELDHTSRSTEFSQTEYVGVQLARMRRHAKRYRYHTLIACHPAKLRKNQASGKYEIPTGYDCSDSAHFYNKPDVGITVFREEDDGRGAYSRVGCWKAKHEGVIGKKGGKMTFRFDQGSHRYFAAPELLNSQEVG